MSCGAGRRRGSDPAFLWLWCRPVATAPITPLAWEPPYAGGAALEKAKRPKKKKLYVYIYTFSEGHQAQPGLWCRKDFGAWFSLNLGEK